MGEGLIKSEAAPWSLYFNSLIVSGSQCVCYVKGRDEGPSEFDKVKDRKKTE